MALTGACSNPAPRPKIAEANRVRAKLVAGTGRAAPASKLAPRQAPATAAIAEVLQANDGPLAIADIWHRVEQRLGRPVNRASVKAWLAEMAASERYAVKRVGRGRYVSTDVEPPAPSLP
jgi:hypothetical protein